MAADEPTLTIARLNRFLENTPATELSLPQYRVLGVLASGDERASLLAARLAVAKPTLTSLVDSLVERGLVVRDTLDGDRRAVSLSITTTGRDMLTRTAKQLRDNLDAVVARCPNPALVLDALQELRGALDAVWAERVAERVAEQAAVEPAGAGR